VGRLRPDEETKREVRWILESELDIDEETFNEVFKQCAKEVVLEDPEVREILTRIATDVAEYFRQNYVDGVLKNSRLSAVATVILRGGMECGDRVRAASAVAVAGEFPEDKRAASTCVLLELMYSTLTLVRILCAVAERSELARRLLIMVRNTIDEVLSSESSMQVM